VGLNEIFEWTVPIQIPAYDSDDGPLQNLLITKGVVISNTESRSVRYFSCRRNPSFGKHKKVL